MCPPMRAHWHHLANTIELVIPSTHPSPQPKRQIHRFSHFCTTHSRKSLYFPPKNPPTHGGSRPHLTHDSLGPAEPTTRTASRSAPCSDGVLPTREQTNLAPFSIRHICILTVRHFASTVYAEALRLFVRQSVRLSVSHKSVFYKND